MGPGCGLGGSEDADLRWAEDAEATRGGGGAWVRAAGRNVNGPNSATSSEDDVGGCETRAAEVGASDRHDVAALLRAASLRNGCHRGKRGAVDVLIRGRGRIGAADRRHRDEDTSGCMG